MSALTAFEVQSFRNGNWKIETITDDKSLALHQAEQVIMNPAVAKVRVIEEAYDQASEQQKFRIVFLRDKKMPSRTQSGPAPEKTQEVAPPPEITAKPAAGRSASIAALSLKFGAIVCAGIAVIIALRIMGTN